MSSYTENFRHKKTGAIHSVDCLDDYFGRHAYGYRVAALARIFREDEFNREYEKVSNEKA